MAILVEKILEKLQEGAETTADLLHVMLTDRSTSYRRARSRLRYEPPPKFKRDWAQWYRAQQSFYSIMNKLKREGFISKKPDKTGTVWKITKKGEEKIQFNRNRQRKPGGIPMKIYPIRKSLGLVIVAYDIPEKERGKRDWLRANLIAFNLRFLQKSVWVGTVQIPSDFLKDLKRYNLLSHVHIFSVNQSGTIIKTV